MEHGKLLVLMQPAELVIIGGAPIGTITVIVQYQDQTAPETTESESKPHH